jgi:hypothetical protein
MRCNAAVPPAGGGHHPWKFPVNTVAGHHPSCINVTTKLVGLSMTVRYRAVGVTGKALNVE